MGEPQTSSSPPSTALTSIYARFRDHCSAPRNETHLAVVEAIRGHYPNALVTAVDVDECNILEYAAAGHATARLNWQGDNFIGQRSYSAPKTRLEEGEGTLGEKVRFGQYRLDVQGQQFEFFIAKWSNPFQSSQNKIYIVSADAADVDADGHSAAVDALILKVGKWTSELHKEIYVFDDGEWDKSPLLWQAVQSANWDDVIIDPAMKDALIHDVHSFFDSRALFQEYAVPWKRGIIMHGTPGCGKTISIKALMNSLEKRSPPVASLYVKSFDCCAGLQYSVRQIFTRARVMAPCLLVFEDLDSLVVNKVRSYFLNEVDGLENNDGILMIGSTNHLERLDPGISKRPSRFDRKYHYKLPSERERVMYCDYWKKKVEKNSNIDYHPEISTIVAKATEGFSFAYLKELFIQTLVTLAVGRHDEVDATDADEPKATTADDQRPAEANGEAAAKGQTVEAIDAAGKTRKMPEIEIPEHLGENQLLRILRKQLIALWKDMDNSETSEQNKGGDGGDDNGEEEEDDGPQNDFQRHIRLLRKHNNRRDE